MLKNIVNNLNFLDYVFLIVIVWFLLVGIKRGFIRQLIALLLLLLIIIGSVFYSQILANYLHIYVHNPDYALLIAFLSILIAGILLSMIINLICKIIMADTEKTFGGRLIGGLLGVIESIALLMIVTLLLTNSSWQQASWLQKSQFYLHTDSFISWLQNKAFNGPLFPTKTNKK
ncbi:MAG: hypothetical protein A3E87_03265 [Gammaproteobacteria bacterium RIFCSPHIGHO2_12_FULL_35_23]|nr:MAG: hypothetical protein A3E87_03265 [Gammaproteobacteria bacterium RIFCSPHIGHO2_12_FULL_35_23]